MIFEWNGAKSHANKLNHGIDFETAKGLWLDENRLEIHAPHPIENRSLVIGKIQGKCWTAVFTMRNTAIRIISVRRSRAREAYLYEKETR